MFYWSHRALHHPSVYQYVHKVHHQFHTPVGPSSAHEHIVESTIQLFNWYLPIGLAGYLNKDLHSSTLFYYNCFRWFETVDAHCGFEFPLSPFHALPIFGGARMHDFHHREFYGNYGASMFWDWFCGTDQDFWFAPPINANS
jgi:sterol desaturase/sphingolipid hydroxylase (fatty acid hydroxylase superfamily)